MEIFTSQDEYDKKLQEFEAEVAAEQKLQQDKKGHITPWKELYFPKSCGSFPGGVRPDVPQTTTPIRTTTTKPGPIGPPSKPAEGAGSGSSSKN